MRARWRAGERLARRASDHGREAVLTDPVLAAANWGIVPERTTTWRAVKPTPNPAVAAALPAPSCVVPAVAPAPAPVVVAAPVAGIHALTAAERRARPAARHIRVLGEDEARTRRLRRGTDPALVVSCWSDASSARALPDELVSLGAHRVPR
jgi:hypothetical protein